MIDFLRLGCPVSLLYLLVALAFVGWHALGVLIVIHCHDIAEKNNLGAWFFPNSYGYKGTLVSVIRFVWLVLLLNLWPFSMFFYFFYYLAVQLGRFIADRFYPED